MRFMKKMYRGFLIEANRERSMGGWENIYYSIISKDETLTLDEGFYDSDDTLRDFIDSLKNIVDDYHNNPELYEGRKDK